MLTENGKHHSVTQAANLLHLRPKVLVAAYCVLQDAARSVWTLECDQPPDQHRIDSEEAEHGVPIPAVDIRPDSAHKLHQVGGCGLLGHVTAKYPAGDGMR